MGDGASAVPAPPASGDIAASGSDGQRADRLLDASRREGVEALYRLVRKALTRSLGGSRDGSTRDVATATASTLGLPPGSIPAPRLPQHLFTAAERDALVAALAATNGTAELLGRARIRERQAQALARRGPQKFAEPAFAFADGGGSGGSGGTGAPGPLRPLAPEAAVRYFQGLTPTLGVDPERFGLDQRRRAFTLAESMDLRLTERIQEAIRRALAEGQTGPVEIVLPDGRRVEWTPHTAESGDQVMLLVDPQRLDAAWQASGDNYIEPGGGGATAMPGRRRDFEQFLATGRPVQAPRIGLGPDGIVRVEDGRHRLSVIRDMGGDQIPVMVPPDQADEFRRRFAATRPPARSLWGAEAIEQILEQVGVHPRNPQYAEMVFRTNMMDAYTQGMTEELQDPDVIETFPVWRYDGIEDDRAGDDHRPKFGRYYPSSVAFAVVRGPRVFNCRCVQTPIDKWTWALLQEQGARVETSW